LKQQISRGDARVSRNSVRAVQERLPFADRDHAIAIDKRQQVVKPPNAAEADSIVAPRPRLLEVGELPGGPKPIPIVHHVEQAPAARAADPNFLDAARRPAVGRNATLEDSIRLRGNGQWSSTPMRGESQRRAPQLGKPSVRIVLPKQRAGEIRTVTTQHKRTT
jgi:hypothetical protein